MNKVTLYGNLGAKPEMRFTDSGKCVASFSLATREWKDETEWHKIECWESTAKIAGEFLDKGSAVIIEGRIRSNQWTDQEGAKRKTWKIVCERLHLTGSKPKPNPKTFDDEEIPF